MKQAVTEILAFIPARGGSKGIPRKNLAQVGGRSLVARSVGHALAARRVSRVLVSTDDEEIAAAAREAGAEVPFLRPASLAGDEVLDHPVLFHLLGELEKTGYRPDLIVHLRPTAPFRREGWIDRSIELLEARPDADSLRSVSAPAQHPYRIFRIDERGLLDPLLKHEHPTPYLLRRQELPALYYYNCVIDVTRTQTVLQKGSMTGDRILPFMMDPDQVLDIDTPRDLAIARALCGEME
jgi:N-acylneuraminate cytidylyltransferase